MGEKLKYGALNLRGHKLGSLLVLRMTGRKIKRKRVWLCKCDCGVEIEVRHDYLINANNPKTHCGCQTPKGGLPSQYPEEYHIHNSMLRRCYVESHVGYPHYGARGIRVCDQWRGPEGFAQFLKDVGPRPTSAHTLDRRDSNGNYEPNNVRWVTMKVQNRNKRNTIMLPHPTTGEATPAATVAEILGLSYTATRNKYIAMGLWPNPKVGSK